jgi:preprotein translocase subunit SecD
MVSNSGVEYTVRVETERPNKGEIVDLAVKILAIRLDAVGIGGEVNQVEGNEDQIRVRVFGDHDRDLIEKFLFDTHELELKKAVSPPNPEPLKTYPTEQAALAANVGDTEVLPFSQRIEGAASQYIVVERKAIVSGEDIRSAYAMASSEGSSNYSISFSLKDDGAKRFGDWTARNISNYVAIVLDKKVQSAPYIRSQIFDQGVIDGSFSKAEAEEIALSLSSGHIPAKLTVLNQERFGDQ